MEKLIANLVGVTRKARLKGKDYLVASTTLLVPGVLNGSKGPLYYPLEEVQKHVDKWNGMPLVVYHPMLNGEPVSARDPGILESQGIGQVFKARVENGKLVAESWFDIEATRKVDNRILESLEQGIPIELSTGLSAKADPKEGVFNDRNYSAVALDYEPDHLAILPDQKGACSLQDGCGVLNESKEDPMKDKLITELIANCSCWKEEDREILNGFEESRLEEMVENTKKTKEDSLIANAAREGFEDPNGNLHAFNPKENKWDFVAKKEETPEPVQNEEKEETPMTPEEWFNSAPDTVKSALQNAQRIEAREKTSIINSLVAHLEDDASKEKVANRLANRSLEELEDLALLNNRKQPEAEGKKETPNWTPVWNLGAPVQNTAKIEALPLPKMDFTSTN